MRIFNRFSNWRQNDVPVYKQEAQLMLTNGATRLRSVEVNKNGTILGPLRLFAKHVIATTRHNSVGYRYVTFILAVCCSSHATGYTFYAVI